MSITIHNIYTVLQYPLSFSGMIRNSDFLKNMPRYKIPAEPTIKKGIGVLYGKNEC